MTPMTKEALPQRMRNYLATALKSGVKLLHLSTDELEGLLDELEAKDRQIDILRQDKDTVIDTSLERINKILSRAESAEKRIAEQAREIDSLATVAGNNAAQVKELQSRIAEQSMLLEGSDAILADYAETLSCAGDTDSILAAIVALQSRAESAEQALLLKTQALAEMTASHKKLNEGMAAIYNAICAGGASTSLSAILTFAKRSFEESKAAAGITLQKGGE